jgi:hypothetical protein
MTSYLQLTKTGAVGIVLFIVLLSVFQPADPDYFWHLKTGEYIVAHHALPGGDVFSFTRAGQPWVLHEWLFEVLLYGVFAVSGERGVVTVTVALALAAVALVYGAARRIAGSAAAAWIPAAPGLVVMAGCMAPRPQMLTYLLFALYLWVLLGFKYAGRTRGLFLLPPLMVVWVNAHAAFAIGIAMVLLFAACEWLVWATAPIRNQENEPGHRQRLLRLSFVAGLVVLASLVNPGLFERWAYPFQVLGMSVNALIQEWQSPDFHSLVPKAYLGLVLLFPMAWVYARRKPDLTEAVLPLVFAVNGCISARHMPLAVLVLVPSIALALASGPLAATAAWTRSLGPVRWYLAQRGAGKELGKREFVVNWVLAAAVALCLPPWLRSQHPDRAAAERSGVEARGAADFLAAHGVGSKLFNDYGDGGYLIYRLAPRFKVAVDGRADVYGDRFIDDYLQVYGGAADWKAKFDRLAVDLAVLPLDAPIRQLLLADAGFREIYRDKHRSVLQRDPAHTN